MEWCLRTHDCWPRQLVPAEEAPEVGGAHLANPTPAPNQRYGELTSPSSRPRRCETSQPSAAG
eukprot:scaffold133069_cov21-Phaeocystis_antarctica.AAC.1